MASTVILPRSNREEKNPNLFLTLIGLGLAGIGLWKGFNYLKEIRAGKSIDKSTEQALKHELNLKRTQQKIAEVERRAFVTGMNAYKKNVTVNIINQANEIINSFFIVITDKNGLKKYYLRKKENINASTIRNAIFSTPLKSIGLLQQVYNIYTGRNLLNDCQKLPPKIYAEIKTIFELAYKKYGR